MRKTEPLVVDDQIAMRAFGAALIAVVKPGAVITLSGELGTGKTTLVRGALQAAGVVGGVRSPTYTLVEYYPLEAMALAHFDLYRLSDSEELEYLGYRDYLNPQTICFIEWPERAQGFLQATDLCVHLSYDPRGRQIVLEAKSEAGCQVIDQLI